LIHAELEAEVWRLVRQAAERTDVMVYAVGGIPDHVHVAASIPPSIAISEAVGRIKGGSSRSVNQITGGGFAWQAEYGAVSFSERNLSAVIDYIRDQKRHHMDKSLWPGLERIADPD